MTVRWLGLVLSNRTPAISGNFRAILIVEWPMNKGAQAWTDGFAAIKQAREVLLRPRSMLLVDAARGAGAFLVSSDWDECRHLNYFRIRRSLRDPIGAMAEIFTMRSLRAMRPIWSKSSIDRAGRP